MDILTQLRHLQRIRQWLHTQHRILRPTCGIQSHSRVLDSVEGTQIPPTEISNPNQRGAESPQKSTVPYHRTQSYPKTQVTSENTGQIQGMHSHITIESTFTSKCLTAISVRHRNPQKNTRETQILTKSPDPHQGGAYSVQGSHTHLRGPQTASDTPGKLKRSQATIREHKCTCSYCRCKSGDPESVWGPVIYVNRSHTHLMRPQFS